MPLKSREARRLSVAGLASLATLAVAASPAAAVQTKTLNYQCKYPLIGVKKLSIKIDLDIPNTWPAGEATPPFGVNATASAFDMAAGLEAVDGLTSIQGTSTAFATVKTAQGFTVPAKTITTIAKTKLPNPVPNPLVLQATGSTPPLTFDEPGTETIVLDRLAINLTALDGDDGAIQLPPVTKDIDGNKVSDSDGDPNTFDVYCKLDAGQDTTLGKFDIVEGGSTPGPTPTPGGSTPTPTPTPTTGATPTPVVSTPTPTPKPSTGPVLARLSYTVQGTTQINTLTKGPVPITGALDAQLDTATGNYTAALQLNPTTGRLTVIGFLPVTVGITIVPSGQVSGKLDDDQLTANLRFRTKLTTVKLFGAIPIAGGNECQTKQLSDLALTSTDSFDPTGTGGTIAGTYALSDLNGCGPFNGIVSPFTQGSGNTITLKVTPKL